MTGQGVNDRFVSASLSAGEQVAGQGRSDILAEGADSTERSIGEGQTKQTERNTEAKPTPK